jgi:hypothetical protein
LRQNPLRRARPRNLLVRTHRRLEHQHPLALRARGGGNHAQHGGFRIDRHAPHAAAARGHAGLRQRRDLALFGQVALHFGAGIDACRIRPGDGGFLLIALVGGDGDGCQDPDHRERHYHAATTASHAEARHEQRQQGCQQMAARVIGLAAGRQRPHCPHALDQPRIVADQFVEGHPEALGFARLLDEGAFIHRAPAAAAGSQGGEAEFGIQGLLAGGQAVAVAGVFARPRIGRADQRQERRRQQHGGPVQVLALDVADLVADIKIQRIRVVVQAVDHVRVQHQEVASQEAGGEGIQRAAHLQQIGFRLARQAQLGAALPDLALEVGELFVRDAHASALDVRNQGRLRETVKQEKHQRIAEHRPAHAGHQRRPGQQREHEHQPKQGLFVLVYQIHDIPVQYCFVISIRQLYLIVCGKHTIISARCCRLDTCARVFPRVLTQRKSARVTEGKIRQSLTLFNEDLRSCTRSCN